MKKEYNLRPKIKVENIGKILNMKKIVSEINSLKYKNILIETYPGVRLKEVRKQILSKLNKKIKIFWSENYALQGKNFRKAILPELTEDRVFGKWTRYEYKKFFTQKIASKNKYKLCYGTGATYLIKNADLVIYIDLTRWEIQRRYQENEKVFFGGTIENEKTKNFKRGYFIEWRMADKIKKKIMPTIDYYVDSTTNKWNVISKKQFFEGLEQASKQPFRLVPYFDFGVWGGNWMENKFKLGKNKYSRWAWGFDGVPEENSIILEFEKEEIEMPANNMVYFKTLNLLGERVQNRFGEDFPIRFDFLDTIKGQNLSLQVHPTFQYIRDNFWAPYTQEESYYILDVDNDASPAVYLGLKTNIKKEKFIASLEEAQKTNKLNVEKYVNKFQVKRHDHFLHPAGVVHSSGAGCMVLEISSTPYIFTFKLWDWGRLGLNGKPRPINIQHGKNVIDYSFNTEKTKSELINNFRVLENNKNFKIEHTGLHPRQFIETRRITLEAQKEIILNNHNSVNMLNLVEGEQIIVKSFNSSFNSLVINYAETFIIPATCKKYIIKNLSEKKKQVKIIQAYVKTNA